MRIDRSDDGGERPDAADVRGAHGADTPVAPAAHGGDAPVAHEAHRAHGADTPVAHGGETPVAHGGDAVRGAGPDRGTAAGWPGVNRGDEASTARAERSLEYREKVARAERAHAIDQGYARVKEIEEKTVTPAMRRIEAEDPDRHLAGLEHRLKGKDRLTEKIAIDVEKKGRSVNQAFANVKDAIRYTFVYEEDKYTAGVYTDCERLENAGFGRFDRRNSWDHDEYKGVNSRWRIPGTNQMFEVQFHTQTSLDAKEETHWAYERIRSASDDAEVAQLHAYQRAVTSKVPIPPNAREIPDYRS